MKSTLLESTLTCPTCGQVTLETMPMNACVYYFECQGCGGLMTPKPGDCCVFCSYGSTPCPPVQQNSACCQPTVA